MLKFNAETARLLEIAYQGADVTRRRRASFDAAHLNPGDQVTDIGCGNGLLTLEMARAVGDAGRIIGVDPSAEMRALAQERCKDFGNVEIANGTAENIPLKAHSIDKAVSLQVFEYLSDIPAALAEARRILKQNGRLVIGDMHWDTLAWRSEDASRMTKMTDAWDKHLANKRVPECLPEFLTSAGFRVETVEPIVFCDTVLKPDGLANMLRHLMQSYAVENTLLEKAEAMAWFEEQEALARDGRFFFSLTHYVITARPA